MIIKTIMLIAGGYLLGSVSPSFLFYRKLRGDDIRSVGDGNPGAANIASSVGSTHGFAIAFIDFCKGIVPLLAARSFGLGTGEMILVGLATVAGHDYSVFLGFKGGKGTMTSLGVLSFLLPFETVLAFSSWLFFHFILKIRFIGSVLTFLLIPLFAWLISCRLEGQPLYLVLLPAGILALFISRMFGNIKDFFSGIKRRTQ